MPNKTYALEWMKLAHKNIETARLLIRENHYPEDIIVISDYYETDRYPGPKYSIPSRNEVEEHIIIAETIYQEINIFIVVN